MKLKSAAQSENIETLPRGGALLPRRPLWKDSTQTVVGEGRMLRKSCWSASSPATRRTSSSHPFVGPAGQIPRALEQAGIDRNKF